MKQLHEVGAYRAHGAWYGFVRYYEDASSKALLHYECGPLGSLEEAHQWARGVDIQQLKAPLK